MKHLAHFFLPFTLRRLDEEERLVEGYCYVNPRVKGDRWNLKRSALERASTGYMEMPCIRSMHQPIAAGVGQAVTWDETGCLLTAKIVDDNEWRKVKEGVYRGFSIGGRPLVARGNEIEEFDWLETSLVDRPGDPEARITLVRADEPEEAWECVQLEEAEPEAQQKPEPKSESVPASPPESVGEAAPELVPEPELQAAPPAPTPEPTSTPVEPAPNTQLLHRLEQAEGELHDLQEEVKRLRAMPAAAPSPAKHGALAGRQFAANLLVHDAANAAKAKGLREERDALVQRAHTLTNSAQRDAAAHRALKIEEELRRLQA